MNVCPQRWHHRSLKFRRPTYCCVALVTAAWFRLNCHGPSRRMPPNRREKEWPISCRRDTWQRPIICVLLRASWCWTVCAIVEETPKGSKVPRLLTVDEWFCDMVFPHRKAIWKEKRKEKEMFKMCSPGGREQRMEINAKIGSSLRPAVQPACVNKERLD